MKKISVIGGGVAGLAAACVAAKNGDCAVTLLEKNADLGGRGRAFAANGFMFDMGPSWYWMPDIFEDFFELFGHTSKDFYHLDRLDPAFRMVFSKSDIIDVPGTEEGLFELFARLEPGADRRLRQFFDEAAIKYELGVKKLAFKRCSSIFEFFDLQLLANLHKLHLFKRFDTYVGNFFSDPRLRTLMEFPILFLGTLPSTTPALYSFMNYGGLANGTWYPRGGMCSITHALTKIASGLGVELRTDAAVTQINLSGDRIHSLSVGDTRLDCDGVIASADYHHVEQKLLPEEHRRYSAHYWDKRVLAPSSLIFYVGLSQKVDRLLHHNLFFDADFPQHAKDLTSAPKWPDNPLFYVCCPSKSDPTVAPTGSENLFILVPIAAGLSDSAEARASIRRAVFKRLTSFTGTPIEQLVSYEKEYCLSDFTHDYNALKGNAYGLANTLMQTAVGKPQMVSSKVSNLVYAGQLTVPGPGLPPSLISGQIAAREMATLLNQRR